MFAKLTLTQTPATRVFGSTAGLFMTLILMLFALRPEMMVGLPHPATGAHLYDDFIAQQRR